MDRMTLDWPGSSRLQAAGKTLRRTVDRSPPLRTILALGLNAGGCLLMLSPVILLVSLTIASILIGNNIQGPLDWLLIEVSVSTSLVAAIVCYQLYRMHPATADGISIEAELEPRLFAMLERRRSHFGLPPFEAVKLATDTEIRVLATPRWPIPLLHSYTLSLGAPLLFFISEAQFRLQLAGAVAASARERRSAAGWARQAARDWPVIIHTLEEHPGLASRLLLPALRWIAASNKMLGDTASSGALQVQAEWIFDHTDEHTIRELLSSQVLATAYTQWQYWPATLKGAERCPRPVGHPFSHFDLLLKGTFTHDAARRWLLRAQAGSDTAQRELQDLLAELKIDFLQCPALPESSAFAEIFEHAEILKALDRQWQQQILPHWQQRHTEFQTQKMRFEQLQKRSQQHELRGDSAINFVRLAQKFLDKPQAINVFRKMYRDNTDNPAVCYTCGEAMLAAGHSLEGCDALQRAADLDTALANRAHALISQHKQSWLNRKPRKRELARIA